MLRLHAQVAFLATAEGGRKGPVQSGYRGTIHVGELYLTGSMHFDEDRWVHPGESVEAEVTVVSGADFLAALPPDKSFDITEGSKVVGRGRVVGRPNAVVLAESEATVYP